MPRFADVFDHIRHGRSRRPEDDPGVDRRDDEGRRISGGDVRSDYCSHPAERRDEQFTIETERLRLRGCQRYLARGEPKGTGSLR